MIDALVYAEVPSPDDERLSRIQNGIKDAAKKLADAINDTPAQAAALQPYALALASLRV